MFRFRFLLFITLLFLSACSYKESITYPEIPSGELLTELDTPKNRFDTMLEKSISMPSFLMEGSLRLGQEGETNRVNFLLWGNEFYPYRLDISLAGSTIFQIYEDQKGVLLYIKKSNTVYYYKDIQSAFEVSQIEIPFNLKDILALAQGNFSQGFENIEYVSSSYDNVNDTYSYNIPFSQKSKNLFYGTWTLDKFARPVSWAQKEWFVEFEYDEETFSDRAPHKIAGQNLKNELFTLFIRERSQPKYYSPSDLEFKLPADVKTVY